MIATLGRDAVIGDADRPDNHLVSAWIGLGGNHAESAALIRSALKFLAAHDSIRVLRTSRIYSSPPWGLPDQPDFFNGVAELETSLPAIELLSVLLEVEDIMGRVRSGPRWGPRSIDLDLLTYGDLTLNSDRLELPHPRMHLRAFVLVPILELERGFEIPGIGPALSALEQLDRQEVNTVHPLAE